MGSHQVKKYRKIAEKAANAQAFILAQAQIKEIMNSPFKVRWRFCRQILFPPKVAKGGDQKDIAEKARGMKLMEAK